MVRLAYNSKFIRSKSFTSARYLYELNIIHKLLIHNLIIAIVARQSNMDAKESNKQLYQNNFVS